MSNVRTLLGSGALHKSTLSIQITDGSISLGALIGIEPVHLNFFALPFEENISFTGYVVSVLTVGSKQLQSETPSASRANGKRPSSTNIFLGKVRSNGIEEHIEGTWNQTRIIQWSHHRVRFTRTRDSVREKHT